MTENVSRVVCRVIQILESSTLKEIKEIKWIGMVNDSLNAIEQTLVAINRVLPDAQEQQSKNRAIKNWLQDLKAVAMDIEDEINLILTQHDQNLKVTTLHQRFPGKKRAREVLKALGQRLDEVDRTRKQFALQEQATFPCDNRRSLVWCFATGLVREKSLNTAMDDLQNELILRVEDKEYRSGRPPTLEEQEKYPKFCRLTEHGLYRVQNCRAGENRRR